MVPQFVRKKCVCVYYNILMCVSKCFNKNSLISYKKRTSTCTTLSFRLLHIYI